MNRLKWIGAFAILLICMASGCGEAGTDDKSSKETVSGTTSVTSAESSEKEKPKETEQSFEEDKLYGAWQYGSRDVGAGYNHIYIFNDDGTYRFQHSQYDGENREKGHSGEWKIDGNKIVFTVKKKTMLEGGTLEEASPSVLSGKEIVGGEIKEISLDSPESLEYVVGNYDEENGTVKINGEEFWSVAYYEEE